MNLVNDDEAQVTEEFRYQGVLAKEHCFEGLGSYLEYSGWLFEHFSLVGLCNIAVPVPNRNVSFLAQLCQSRKLIVDEGFQRTDVDCTDRARWIL